MVGSLGGIHGSAMSPGRSSTGTQNTQKDSLELEQRHFEETLRSQAGNPKALVEVAHLRRFNVRGLHQAQTAYEGMMAERTAHRQAQETFRNVQLEKSAGGRSEKLTKLKRDKSIHDALLKHKEGMEREDLSVELALSEKVHRKKLVGLQHAALDVSYGIDSFEINMKRLVRPGDQGEDDGDDNLRPAAGRLQLDVDAGLLKARLETIPYMRGVKDALAEGLAFKREREARRRKVLVEQQAGVQEAEQKAQEADLVAALSRESEEEQRLAALLWQQSHEKEVVREERMLREQRYKERRGRDWDETIKRDIELHRSTRQQRDQEAAVRAEARKVEQEQRAAAKAEKRQQFAETVAWQMVQLAERVIVYRSKSGGSKIPRRLWTQWIPLFESGDSSLGDPVIKLPPVEEGDGLQDSSGEPSKAPVNAAVRDYLTCKNDFATVDGQPIGHDIVLAAAVLDLAKAAQPDPPPPELPEINVPLRLAVVGPPFAGKTSLCQELSRRFRVQVLDVKSLVAEAAKAAEAFEGRYRLAFAERKAKSQGSAMEAEAGEALAGDGERAPVEAVPLPVPSAVERLGEKARKAMEAMEDPANAVLVGLAIEGMKASKKWMPPVAELETKGAKKAPPPAPSKTAKSAIPAPTGDDVNSRGFVLDGFPRTEAQAILLERALTGLDLDGEHFLLDTQSLVAPPPASKLPQPERPLTSGLDAFICLTFADEETAEQRATRRGLQDGGSDFKEFQSRLTIFNALAPPLNDWLKRFARLRRPVDCSLPMAEVIASASDVTDAILRSKAAGASCDAAAAAAAQAKASFSQALEHAGATQSCAEAVARQLLETKKVEIQATVLLGGGGKNADPAAAEFIKAQTAARCAEQLKICRSAAQDASSCAERANTSAKAALSALQRAQQSLKDAEIIDSASATEAATAASEAEKAARAAADWFAKARASKEVSDTASAEAEKFASTLVMTNSMNAAVKAVEPPVEEARTAAPGASEAAGAGSAAVKTAPSGAQTYHILLQDKDLCKSFYEQWQQMEQQYLDGLSRCLWALAEEHRLTHQHFLSLQQQFVQLLKDPLTEKDELVSAFQTKYNASIESKSRARLKEAPREWSAVPMPNAEELREALWSLCDAKMEAAEAQRARVTKDSFVADHTKLLVQYFIALAQVELDRTCATLSLVREVCNAYSARYCAKPLPDAIAAAAAANQGILSPTLALSSGGQSPEDLRLTGLLEPVSDENANKRFPTWLSSLEGMNGSSFAPLQTALKVAVATVRLAVRSWEFSSVEPTKGDMQDTQPGGRGEDIEVPPLDTPEAQADVSQSDNLQACGAREAQILEARLELLVEKAVSHLQQLNGQAADVVARMGTMLKDRYCKECNAVNKLYGVVQGTLANGRLLPVPLLLEDDLAVLDEDEILRGPAQPPPPPAPPAGPPPPPGLLTTQQLALITNAFRAAAPAGFLKITEAADILFQFALEGALPASWQGAGVAAFVSACGVYDPVSSSYLDWREVVTHLVLAAFPVISNADCPELADAVEMLVEADKDADGLLSNEEWHDCELWFQYKRPEQVGAGFPAADEVDTAAAYTEDEDTEMLRTDNAAESRHQHREHLVERLEHGDLDEAGRLKQVLWDAFHALPEPIISISTSGPLEGDGSSSGRGIIPSASDAVGAAPPASTGCEGDARLDFRACLLYLCADRDIFSGLKKAFSIAAGSLSPSAKCTAPEVFKVLYPLGPTALVDKQTNRAMWSQDDVGKLVAAVKEARSVAAGSAAPVGVVPVAAPASADGIAVSAEQLMYSAPGERLVKRALDRYQWKDLYVRTKL